MTSVPAQRAVALAGVALAVTVLALAAALAQPSAVATAVTLGAMAALGYALHAIGRTHPGS